MLSENQTIELVDEFIHEYFETSPIRITPISNGVASRNYDVTCRNANYIVRLDRRRTVQELSLDVDHMIIAKSVGVNVPIGPYVVVEYQKHSIIARPKIEGRQMSTAQPLQNTIFEQGRQLGLVHEATVPDSRSYFYQFVIDSTSERWDLIGKYAYSYNVRGIVEIAKEATEYIRRNGCCYNDSGSYPKTLIHGDYKLENILVIDDDSICVLDWEKSCYAPRILDLGLGLFHVIFAGEVNGQQNALQFLNGYFSVQRYSCLEHSHLGNATVLAGMAWFLLDITFVSRCIHNNDLENLTRRMAYFQQSCVPTFMRFYNDMESIDCSINSINALGRRCLKVGNGSAVG